MSEKLGEACTRLELRVWSRDTYVLSAILVPRIPHDALLSTCDKRGYRNVQMVPGSDGTSFPRLPHERKRKISPGCTKYNIQV